MTSEQDSEEIFRRGATCRGPTCPGRASHPQMLHLGFGDLSNLSHSYPFLDLSLRIGVPYERVLGCAKRLDSGWIDPDNLGHLRHLAQEQGLSLPHVDLVARVCAAPWRWQFPPQGRGL